ncbi:hypothetical protein CUMW_212050, partial [Citrus unshiu]
VGAIRCLIDSNLHTQDTINVQKGAILHEDRVGDLSITVKRDTVDASLKSEDTSSLGTVIVRHCGYTAVVKVVGDVTEKFGTQDIEIEDQPDGGANSLNINRSEIAVDELMKMAYKYYDDIALPKLVTDFGSLELSPVDGLTLTDFMHLRGLQMRSLGRVKSFSAESARGDQSPLCNLDNSEALRSLVRRVIKQSLAKLELEPTASERSIRWELGSCWVQHLQKQETPTDTKSTRSGDDIETEHAVKDTKSMRSGDDIETEHAVKGLGKQFKFLKKRENRPNLVGSNNEANEDDNGPCSMNVGTNGRQQSNGELNCEMELKKLISEESFLRLKETGTGLHSKAVDELMKMTYKYYDDIALPKLVTDFGSLELSPVDGRTLTDFMHLRGLQMRSLGRVVELAEKLPHIQSLCIHEMVTRAFKHTAASYHAIAVALSLMEAYSLSVQHEQTTLKILQAKLGLEDLRTQDAAAWLEYFESKALEQQEAARNGTPKPDASIASKGHLSVSDLLDYISPGQDSKRSEAHRKQRRAKVMQIREKIHGAHHDMMVEDALPHD